MELINYICNVLKDRNIVDVKVIHLKYSSIANYVIIGSGTSRRQMVSCAEFLYSELKKKQKTLIEKGDESSWILLATDDIIVHLFKPEVREEYNLEALYDISA